MFISEIQQRLIDLIDKHPATRNCAFGLALYNGANPKEVSDSYHLALWFEGARRSVKEDFMEIFDECNIRVCTNCGKFMIDGYILPDYDYACSDECAIQNYIRDVYNKDSEDHKITREQAETMFHYDLEDCDDDCYWTEW